MFGKIDSAAAAGTKSRNNTVFAKTIIWYLCDYPAPFWACHIRISCIVYIMNYFTLQLLL